MPAEGATHDVLDPATEQVVQTVWMAGVAETDAAVERAAAAQVRWAALAPADRGRLLRRFAGGVGENVGGVGGGGGRGGGGTPRDARWGGGDSPRGPGG